MSTIYVPVLIESAEQAEALPVGTVVVHYPRHGMEDQAGIRVRGGWEFTGSTPDVFGHQEAVGMEALVPIEAEEHVLNAATFANPNQQLRRYVTPWEHQS